MTGRIEWSGVVEFKLTRWQKFKHGYKLKRLLKRLKMTKEQWVKLVDEFDKNLAYGTEGITTPFWDNLTLEDIQNRYEIKNFDLPLRYKTLEVDDDFGDNHFKMEEEEDDR